MHEDELLEQLRNCEAAVWDALVSGDAAADAQALDELFLGVYPDGFANKSMHVAQLAGGPTVEYYALKECRVIKLSADTALFAYRSEFKRTSSAQPEAMYVSSIWRKQTAGWINIFSQDTPAVE